MTLLFWGSPGYTLLQLFFKMQNNRQGQQVGHARVQLLSTLSVLIFLASCELSQLLSL